MRLIDADAFSNYIKRAIEDQAYDSLKMDDITLTVGDVLDAVIAELDGTSIVGFKNAPTIEPEPHWIPCSERLPKPSEHKDDMVLVCYGNGSMRFDTCMNGEWVYGNPIAWMPLPEPYKENEDGD